MKKIVLATAALMAISTSAQAEVKSSSDNGFVVIHNEEVNATPAEIWERLVSPKDWWDAAHSWSGKAEGFTLEPRANGCFCEEILEDGEDGELKSTGSVEHMRVIFAQNGKVLRMQGALGPLQSEAVTGTFTVAIAPRREGEGSKMSFSYVVGGYMRYNVDSIAPAVDKVLGDQLASLIKPFGVIKDPLSDKPSNWSLDIDSLIDDTPTDEKAAGEGGEEPSKKPDVKAKDEKEKSSEQEAEEKKKPGSAEKKER